MARKKQPKKVHFFPLFVCKIKQIHHQEHFATFQVDLEQNLAEVRVDIQAAHTEKTHLPPNSHTLIHNKKRDHKEIKRERNPDKVNEY
jgi:hypothetical protein